MFSVSCMRAGASRLVLALMFGLLFIPGVVVAPILFELADSRHLAGHLAGGIFHAGNLSLLVLVLVQAGLWWQTGVKKYGWLMLGIVAALVAVNEFFISAILSDLKMAMGPIDLVPEDNPLRQRFGLWHGISAMLHFVAMLMLAAMVTIGISGKTTCRQS